MDVSSVSSLFNNSLIQTSLQYVGGATVTYLTLRFLRFLHLYTRRSSIAKYLIKSPTSEAASSWAIITGASDGIGLALAHELASHGFNLLLHGRNESKLNKACAELRAKFPQREVRMFIADAGRAFDLPTGSSSTSSSTGAPKSQNPYTVFEDFAATVRDLPGPATMLFNNVGGNTIRDGKVFAEMRAMTHDEIDRALNINARFTVHLTRALLPVMLADKKRPCFVGVTGSVSGIIGLPYIAPYGSSKAFLYVWMQGLTRELWMEGHANFEGKYFVIAEVTATSHNSTPVTAFIPTAEVLAKDLIKRVGSARLVVTPHFRHEMQRLGVNLIPEELETVVSSKATASHLRDFGKVEKGD